MKEVMDEMPFWEKYTLTVKEASEYFHIGEKRFRQIIEENYGADFIIYNGRRLMIKRKCFERYPVFHEIKKTPPV